MRIPCTKIGPGNYDYRGFNLYSEISDGFGLSWFISPVPDGPWWDDMGAGLLDPACTKAGAKRVVDQFIEYQKGE